MRKIKNYNLSLLIVFIIICSCNPKDEALQLTIYSDGNKVGFINENQEIIIPVIYDEAMNFSYSYNEINRQSRKALFGISAVKKDFYWNFIDHTGKSVIQNNYDSIVRSFYFETDSLYKPEYLSGTAIVKKDGKCFYIDTEGNRINQLTFDRVIEAEQHIWVKVNNKFALLNKDLAICSEFYDEVNNSSISFKDNHSLQGFTPSARVFKNNFYFLVNRNGQKISSFYDALETPFSRDLLLARKDEKYGYVASNGKVIIDFNYQDALSICTKSKLGFVKLNNKWGALNKQGDLIIKFEYDSIKISQASTLYPRYPSFLYGLLAAKKDNKWGFIDYSGYIVIPFLYDKVRGGESNTVEVFINGKWTVLNKQGNFR